VNEWDKLAVWMDEKQGDDGDLWHRALIDPTMLRVIGPVTGLDVLDLGCGNGVLLSPALGAKGGMPCARRGA
jgi:2-polyprenyl-3-methyl-5-hydroxy-6-metoxy-1,4-benzoquinol methylase